MDRSRPPGVTRLILVRHGETEASASGRCIGRTDLALSEAGRLQAVALASRLRRAGAAAVYASTSRRAVETADPIATALGVEVRRLADLCEVDFGALEGLTFEEVEASHPRTWSEWMRNPTEVRFPGGEALDDVARRARRARSQVLAACPGQAAVIVSHGGPLRVLLADALGLGLARCFDLTVRHGSAQVLEVGPGHQPFTANRRIGTKAR